MKIYNSLTNKKEEFVPIKDGEVSIYVCGPTVYSYIHIGNARPVIFFDVMRRYLEYKGYNVKFVSNITDVDDKIINAAIEAGVPETDIVHKYLNAFIADQRSLNSMDPDVMPKATEYMPAIIEYIERLIEAGYAYESNGDVYFRVNKSENYGALSNQNVEDLESGARIEINDKKENALDFTLWKETEVGVNWDSPWSKGRPGWHTECVAMIDDVFGSKIDIHAGGSDLKFPHHENEIAQSEVLNNHTIANYWMHNGRLNINNKKMSKSEGELVLVSEMLKDVNANGFRLFMVNTHYRAPINYTFESVKEFESFYYKMRSSFIQGYVELLSNNLELDNKVEINQFAEYMDDDFNTANCITEIMAELKQLNIATRAKDLDKTKISLSKLLKMNEILGVELDIPNIDDEVLNTYKEWKEARSNKDFDKADKLREVLISQGIL